MYIKRIRIKNFKGFHDSGDIALEPGFNVIVGQNNAGKSALVEAVGLRANYRPHRSLANAPDSDTQPQAESQVELDIRLSTEEFIQIVRRYHGILLPQTPGLPPSHAISVINSSLRLGGVDIECTYHTSSDTSVYLQSFSIPKIGDVGHSTELGAIVFSNSELRPINIAELRPTLALHELPGMIKNRIYSFKAERLTLARSPIVENTVLLPDGSNLAQVLHTLFTTNPPRFERYVRLVSLIFADITRITTPVIKAPVSGTTFGDDTVAVAIIKLWFTDPNLEREDLAIPLDECGTGLGQVLALLYIIVTADKPYVIAIDEPQSFLHPGAVRRLMAILKKNPQHQYILSTHSSAVINAASPANILMVRSVDGESVVETLGSGDVAALQVVLDEVGTRVSDLYGADYVLWVEGATEQTCLAYLLRTLFPDSAAGVQVVGVVNTGDFDSKDVDRVAAIYRKLSQVSPVLAPKVGFLFDREERSQSAQDELSSLSRSRVQFTQRRMFENYLLDEDAIAEVLVDAGVFPTHKPALSAVSGFIEGNMWTATCFKHAPEESKRTRERWLEDAHASNLLIAMFSVLSDQCLAYDKVRHGLALTKLIASRNPEAFADIRAFLQGIISELA